MVDRMRRHLVILLLLGACRPSPPAPASEEATEPRAQLATPSNEKHDHRHVPMPIAPCHAPDGDYLGRAIASYDIGDFDGALSCAVQAAAANPDDPDAHSERAAALTALGKLEEARLAYARALAIAPDHPDALLGAADLYLTRLPAHREHTELGLAYAQRGHRNARKAKERQLAAQFAILLATGFNNLGRGAEAIVAAEEAMRAGVEVSLARYEKASALYELCRFEEARREFLTLVDDPARAAFVHHFLGLIAEREGDEAAAEKLFAKARALAPDDFPEEVAISPAEFAELVARTVESLPADMRADLAQVPVRTQDLPDLEDLVGGDPVLSPAILGLFRGPPVTWECPVGEEECRTIVLFRKNLQRVVRSREELEQQVRVTLEHEIGHLRGEDDVQLAARGLE